MFISMKVPARAFFPWAGSSAWIQRAIEHLTFTGLGQKRSGGQGFETDDKPSGGLGDFASLNPPETMLIVWRKSLPARFTLLEKCLGRHTTTKFLWNFEGIKTEF